MKAFDTEDFKNRYGTAKTDADQEQPTQTRSSERGS